MSDATQSLRVGWTFPVRAGVGAAWAGVVALLGVGGVDAASGATIQQTHAFPAATLINRAAASTGDLPLDLVATVDAFNPALGTLTQVDVAFHYSFDVVIEVPATGGGGSAGVTGLVQVNGTTFNGGGGGDGTGIGPTDRPLVFHRPFSVSDDDVFTPGTTPIFFAPFVGLPGSTVEIAYDATMSASNDAPFPGDAISLLLLDDSQVSVTYTYTPIPEPASLGLAAVGGPAMFRRRR